jgi:hypothetical protein
MTKKNDLLVCISRKHKQPSRDQCEKLMAKPKSLDLSIADAEFSHNFLYVGLYSERGCQFTVKVSFPNDKSKLGDVSERDLSFLEKDTVNTKR